MRPLYRAVTLVIQVNKPIKIIHLYKIAILPLLGFLIPILNVLTLCLNKHANKLNILLEYQIFHNKSNIIKIENNNEIENCSSLANICIEMFKNVSPAQVYTN